MLQYAEGTRSQSWAARGLLLRCTLTIVLVVWANLLAVSIAVALSSTTTIVSSANPSTFGDSVTFTVTVSGSGATPTGFVTFFVDGNLRAQLGLSGGVAIFTTSQLGGGTRAISAAYSGDGTYTSSSGTLNQVVNKASSSTAISAAPSPSNVGQSVTFTATVSPFPASGLVTFFVDGDAKVQVPLNVSSASFTTTALVAGSRAVHASYLGSNNLVSSDSVTINHVVKSPATHDFNGGAFSDIAWRQSGGLTAAWLMNGAQVVQSGSLGSVSTDWQIVGQRDFNGDGKYDWLWRNSTDGTVAIWALNGLAILQSSSLGMVPTNWGVAGTADFNGDGKGDILWRDSSAGAVAIWLMGSFLAVSQTGSLGAVSSDWVIVAAGDFDGNGKADILWRNSSTGALAIWLMNGLQVVQSASLGAVSSNWIVVLTGDFNGDGKSDILWHDTSGGTAAIWFMNNVQISSTASIGIVGLDWTIQGLNAN